ncbi:hypothetical protein THICB2_210009 [Thiomonas sp. CB2]|nr:hypothetical protein THICB2_210009 [Thiomonas sp. CB2]VDY05820.1 protein of unknown function [Thiomonas sp. Bio17B3]VDY10882.1 protein of unknown function [Thiomonas sp. Sup16B3]VDY14079.1 conserved protein of unknown function [Thiomonas sp. OC7]VDY16727.1 protein of unknown function [Thiomonas sp. CB2]
MPFDPIDLYELAILGDKETDPEGIAADAA